MLRGMGASKQNPCHPPQRENSVRRHLLSHWPQKFLPSCQGGLDGGGAISVAQKT